MGDVTIYISTCRCMCICVYTSLGFAHGFRVYSIDVTDFTISVSPKSESWFLFGSSE